MSRCIAFYKKCEEQGADWCEKCPDAVSRIEKYLDLCKELESRGVPRDQTIVGLSEGAARPLFSIQEPEIRERAISHVENALKRETPTGGKYTKKLTTGDVKKIIQNIVHADKPKERPLPNGKYNVILADPPWRYEFSETSSRAIENHYPTMSLDEITALDVPTEEDAILLLWTTAPKVEESLAVLNAWGFTYRTCAVWDKERLGLGYWFRIQHELLLVGVKGSFSAPFPENRYSSVIRSPREEHSQKPVIVHEMIERMFPDGKYLELFARSEREGWTCWGNEI